LRLRSRPPDHQRGWEKWQEPQWEHVRHQPRAAAIDDRHAGSVGTPITL
jgi:hypothetical protein